METVSYIREAVALLFVVGLIGVTAFLWRKFAWEKGLQFGQNKGRRPRLQRVESLILDGRRRLMLVRKDDREFLLLLGAESETVLAESEASPPEGNGDENRE